MLALFRPVAAPTLNLADINRKRAAKGLKPLTKIPGLAKL